MSAVEQQVDYRRIRSLVKAAFSTAGNPYQQSPLADHMTNNTQDVTRARRQYEYPWNTTVHARESRRPGRSKELIHRRDWELESVCRRIKSLSGAHKATLDYFYNASSITGKHPVKSLIWAVYLPSLDGCTTDTKAVTLNMLDHLLPQYRAYLLQGEIKDIKHPWRLFSIEGNPIERPAWYRTYHKHWVTLQRQIVSTDEGILDEIR